MRSIMRSSITCWTRASTSTWTSSRRSILPSWSVSMKSASHCPIPHRGYMDRFLRFLSRMLSHIAALLLLMAGGGNTGWAQSGDTPLLGRGGFTPLLGGLGETAGEAGGVREDDTLRVTNVTLTAGAGRS